MPRSTVIVPVFNQAALTERCLQSLLQDGQAEVIVVDDGSTDATPQMLTRYADRIKIVTHPTNQGFAAACNDGAAAASATDFLVFLNNDTLPQPGWLAALEQYADTHPAAAAIGSKLLFPDHTIQHAGVVICQDRYPRHLYTGFPADHPAVNRSRRFQIVTAACLLVRRAVFEQRRGFDPAFRNGFEDVDFCLRLGERGYEVHYCAASVVVHLESVSPGRFKHDRDNVALYRERWLGRVQPDDLHYYLEDGLLRLEYEGRYPIRLDVSPLLATLHAATRDASLEDLLRERSRQVAELLRENTRLRLELDAQAPPSPAPRYHQLREQLRQSLRGILPSGAIVLVISKGDSALLDLPDCCGRHFPQTQHGTYAGHHPADSAAAVAHLETLRAGGATHLLIPAPSLWWLDHYTEFRRHLDTRYRRIEGPDGLWVLYVLADDQSRPTSEQAAGGVPAVTSAPLPTPARV